MTTLNEARKIVNWAGYQNESTNDAFTFEELVRLWRHTQEKECPYEFFDDRESFYYAKEYLEKTHE